MNYITGKVDLRLSDLFYYNNNNISFHQPTPTSTETKVHHRPGPFTVQSQREPGLVQSSLPVQQRSGETGRSRKLYCPSHQHSLLQTQGGQRNSIFGNMIDKLIISLFWVVRNPTSEL